MKIEVLKEKYPKSISHLGNWLLDEAVKFGYKKETSNVIPIDVILHNIILQNPRLLYDFFDHYEIYMTISKSLKGWYYLYDYKTSPQELEVYNSRKEVEEKGFEKCFELLEKKLS